MSNAIDKVKIVKATPKTKAERDRLKGIRDRYQREKPSLEQLSASGEYSEPISQEEFWEDKEGSSQETKKTNR